MFVFGVWTVRWPFSLLKRREEELVERLLKQWEMSTETVRRFKELCGVVGSGNHKEIDKLCGEVDRLETEVDEVRRRIAEDICAGSFFAYLRDDLLNLVEKLDSIADSAKVSAKILRDLPRESALVKKIFSEQEMERYAQLCLDSVLALGDALLELVRHGSGAVKLAHKVEEYEEAADAMKEALLRKILQDAESHPILDVIQLKDFVNQADSICDAAEDASDVILQIIAKGYS
ncbi:MAG: DUF47 family protein [Aigarchaeota archaeon]|nr:DUF47 family protein [Candidatus Pelearchaeum maunauluense]